MQQNKLSRQRGERDQTSGDSDSENQGARLLPSVLSRLSPTLTSERTLALDERPAWYPVVDLSQTSPLFALVVRSDLSVPVTHLTPEEQSQKWLAEQAKGRVEADKEEHAAAARE